MYIWEVAAWEISRLGSCHLGKYPWEVTAWENTLGKLPLGKIPLGKYPWEVTAWEKAFEKVPNICIQCRRLPIFQTINAVKSKSLSLKY